MPKMPDQNSFARFVSSAGISKCTTLLIRSLLLDRSVGIDFLDVREATRVGAGPRALHHLNTERLGHYGGDERFACGNRGSSEWTISGTTVDGESIETRLRALDLRRGREDR